MDLSTAHTLARLVAARLPALQASFSLLDSGSAAPYIVLYSGTRPAPGEAPTGSALVTLTMSNPPGSVDTDLYQIALTTPIEGQIGTSGDATWARITDGAGAWWADVSVSNEAGGGEIRLQTVSLVAGAFARITSAVLQG